MSLELRDYQHTALDEARAALRRSGSVLLQSPTGSGKTCLCAAMFKSAMSKGKKGWFVVHRRELIKQSAETFDLAGIPYGYCAAGFAVDRLKPVQLASVQTLVRRMDQMYAPDFIAWDEAHHLAAGSWDAIYQRFPKALHIGLTATPERLDGTGLRPWFKEMVRGPDVRALIDAGWLADYRLFAPTTVDMGGVHSRYGDFVNAEAEAAMDKPTITGDAVAHYLKLARGKRAVVFAVSVKHSQHVAQQFCAAGIVAVHVDGSMEHAERDRAIEAFSQGHVQVLCAVDLISEGFDIPALEVAILLRPTQSKALYLQQVGRALRISPGKREALILDHCGNTKRHGLPDDEREWSLDGAKDGGRVKGDGNGPAIKQCPTCFAVVRQSAPLCRHCGHAFAAQGREVKQVEGELQEVDKSLVRHAKLQEQGIAHDKAALIELGRKRGYKRPELWAIAVLRARANKHRRAA